MSRFPKRWSCAAMVILLALAGSLMSVGEVSAAATPPYGYGPHTGHYGRHWVLDMYDSSTEYPAVSCRYDDTLKIRSVSIRPPVVFAYDRTHHLDRQDVAWRAVVEYSATPGVGPWTELGRTPLEIRSTTDETAATFHRATFAIPGHPALPSDAAIQVIYRMRWYSASTGDVNGRASDGVYWLRIQTPSGSSLNDGWCDAGPLPTGTLVPYGYGTHEGPFGAHWILDGVGPHPEYPGVTCIYDSGQPVPLLQRLRIRGPIILAYDRTSGPDTRYVGWKARIQVWDGTSWAIRATTSTSKAQATDSHWPTFQTKSHSYHTGSVDELVRVVYSLYWYGSDGHTVVARATHFPKWYGYSDGSDTTDSCHSRLPTG